MTSDIGSHLKSTILDMMGQKVSEMDHLVTPVINEVMAMAEEILQTYKEQRPDEKITRRQAIELALSQKAIDYRAEGATGRCFVLEVFEDYLVQEWENAREDTRSQTDPS